MQNRVKARNTTVPFSSLYYKFFMEIKLIRIEDFKISSVLQQKSFLEGKVQLTAVIQMYPAPKAAKENHKFYTFLQIPLATVAKDTPTGN